MRDDHNFSKTFNVKKTVGSSTWLNKNYKVKTRRSYRSNVTKTDKVGNSYIEPTEYEAFFFQYSTTDFEYFCKNRKRTSRWAGEGAAYGVAFPHVVTHGCATAWPHRPIIPGKLSNRVRNQLYAKIKSGSLDLGQTLGELPQTAREISKSFVTLMRAYRAARAGKWNKCAAYLGVHTYVRLPRTFAEGWLGYQYGWRPLMADIYAGAEYISNGIIPNAAPMVKAYGYDEDYSPPLPYSSYSSEGKAAGEFVRGIETGAYLKLGNLGNYDLESLGLTNPAATAWDLIPLSFVIDWFTGVGNFLRMCTLPFACLVRYAYETTFVRNVYQLTFMHDDGQELLSGQLPTGRVYHKSMYRQKFGSLPIPIPYLDMNLNFSQAFNLLALLTANVW